MVSYSVVLCYILIMWDVTLPIVLVLIDAHFRWDSLSKSVTPTRCVRIEAIRLQWKFHWHIFTRENANGNALNFSLANDRNSTSIVTLVRKRFRWGFHCDPTLRATIIRNVNGNFIAILSCRWLQMENACGSFGIPMQTRLFFFNNWNLQNKLCLQHFQSHCDLHVQKIKKRKFHCGLLAQATAKEIPSQSSCTKNYIVILLCRGMHGDPAARSIAKITMEIPLWCCFAKNHHGNLILIFLCKRLHCDHLARKITMDIPL